MVPSSDRLRHEVRHLVITALPIVATQLGAMLLGVVDTVMVGRLGVDAIGAAALGNVWVMGTLIAGMGLVAGIDPIISQAHGARDGARCGIGLQQGLAMACWSSVPIAGLWLLTEPILIAFGQDPALARAASHYTLVQLPGLPAFLGFVALRSYLSNRQIFWPAVAVVIVANLINVVLNQLLIFGAGPIPAAGVTGAGLATGLTRLSLLLMLVLWVCRFQLHRGAWNGWSKAAWSRERLQETWRLGWPVGLYLGLEIWAFQFITLLAGWLGNSSLAASTIVLNLASLSFMLPLGVAVATAARVGNLIGARQPDAAQRASWVAFGLGASAMSICAILFVALRQFLPRCYTSNVAVIELAARTLPVVAAFQLFDGVQVVGCAVLRGMGRTRPAAVMNLIGYYMLGLPLAWWLAFRRGWGLVGLWLGLAAALMVIAILLVTWVAKRGPKTMRQPLFAGSE